MKNIPKVCYLYWGRMPMSQLQVLTPISFHKYNPEWKIIIYLTKQDPSDLGKNIWVPDYLGIDYFYKVRELEYVEIREVDIKREGFGLDSLSPINALRAFYAVRTDEAV